MNVGTNTKGKAMSNSHAKNYTILTIFLIIFSISYTSSIAGEYTMKISYETSDTHLKARTALKFANRLKELSKDRIEVKMFPNSSLIPSKQEVTAALRGQVEAIMPFVSYYESISASAKVFTMPMIFRDYSHISDAWNGAAGIAVSEDLDQKGLIALGYWYDTPTHLFTTEKPISNLDQVAGMKIRTYPSATLEATIEAFKAVPTVIPGSEVYLALQNGVAEGALTTPAFAASLKLTDVLRHMTRLNLAYGGYIFAVNKKFYQKLPVDLQEAVTLAAKEMTLWNKEAIKKEVAAAEQLMRDAGVAIHDLKAGDRNRWVSSVQPVVDQQSDAIKLLVNKVK